MGVEAHNSELHDLSLAEPARVSEIIHQPVSDGPSSHVKLLGPSERAIAVKRSLVA